MSDFKEYVKTLEDALNLALKALEAISDEMTVGGRYTNAGQHLLDALQPCRNALEAAPPAPAANCGMCGAKNVTPTDIGDCPRCHWDELIPAPAQENSNAG